MWVFWIAAVFVAYTYAGYPLVLWLLAKLRPRAVASAAICPSVSVLLAVRNEAAILRDKIENLRGLDYPKDKIDLVIVSDGSDDATPEILREQSGEGIQTVCLSQRSGKGIALNHAAERARGEILFFTDARQRLERDSICNLVRNFADPTVGCASGELMLNSPGTASGDGLGLYWRFEKKVRELESASGSVVGATGAIYAMRRSLFVEMPRGVILDDVFEPLNVIKQGCRVVFDSSARAWDELNPDASREFARKVRTLMGNYQLIQFMPWTITWANPAWFKFVSHKLCRLFIPIALIVMLLSSALTAGFFYKLIFVAQLVFYASALLPKANRLGIPGKIGGVVRSFLLLNAAAAMAMANVLFRKSVSWR